VALKVEFGAVGMARRGPWFAHFLTPVFFFFFFFVCRGGFPVSGAVSRVVSMRLNFFIVIGSPSGGFFGAFIGEGIFGAVMPGTLFFMVESPCFQALYLGFYWPLATGARRLGWVRGGVKVRVSLLPCQVCDAEPGNVHGFRSFRPFGGADPNTAFPARPVGGDRAGHSARGGRCSRRNMGPFVFTGGCRGFCRLSGSAWFSPWVSFQLLVAELCSEQGQGAKVKKAKITTWRRTRGGRMRKEDFRCLFVVLLSGVSKAGRWGPRGEHRRGFVWRNTPRWVGAGLFGPRGADPLG